MSKKKCKVCGADAEWEFDSEYYCECCLCVEFDVQRDNAPRICETCGDPLDDTYYTEIEGYVFCSAKCALEFHGACVCSLIRDTVEPNNASGKIVLNPSADDEEEQK